MAGTSLLTLLDDIATILDDVATMTNVAARKTAGVLGDDLALNAEQVSGVRADRELPVVWAVFKGSAKNKCILVPAALAISAFVPIAIVPLLMIGGAYLCFEGFEKIWHAMAGPKEEKAAKHLDQVNANKNPEVDMVEFERDKIKGAIRTDFILSAEIIVIALGTVADRSLTIQVGVLVTIAVLMTIGVYGLVAGIVKLDDAGLYLTKVQEKTGFAAFKRKLGALILVFAPYLMKTLSVVGTAAMFLVGGGILVHGLPGGAALLQAVNGWFADSGAAGLLSVLAEMAVNGILGLIAGAILVAVVTAIGKLRGGEAH
ncbi:MAG: DUF808 domain-containing protein [Pseudomonadota bacterium]